MRHIASAHDQKYQNEVRVNKLGAIVCLSTRPVCCKYPSPQPFYTKIKLIEELKQHGHEGAARKWNPAMSHARLRPVLFCFILFYFTLFSFNFDFLAGDASSFLFKKSINS